VAQSAVTPNVNDENMFSKLREILLTQHVGSILVALLVWQAAIEVLARVVRIGFWFFNHLHTESVLEGSSRARFPWDTFIFSDVTVALYLLTAYGLVRWLYPAPFPVTQGETEDGSLPDQLEQP
jgi:hypothetical protein